MPETDLTPTDVAIDDVLQAFDRAKAYPDSVGTQPGAVVHVGQTRWLELEDAINRLPLALDASRPTPVPPAPPGITHVILTPSRDSGGYSKKGIVQLPTPVVLTGNTRHNFGGQVEIRAALDPDGDAFWVAADRVKPLAG